MKRPSTAREQPPSDSEIRALLRAGDPCRDVDELAPDDVARMRRAVLAEAEARPTARRRWLAAAAAAAALAALFAGHSLRLGRGEPEPRTASLRSAPAAAEDRHAREPVVREQHVQFVTSTGIRVIWVLNSDLDL